MKLLQTSVFQVEEVPDQFEESVFFDNDLNKSEKNLTRPNKCVALPDQRTKANKFIIVKNSNLDSEEEEVFEDEDFTQLSVELSLNADSYSESSDDREICPELSNDREIDIETPDGKEIDCHYSLYQADVEKLYIKLLEAIARLCFKQPIKN